MARPLPSCVRVGAVYFYQVMLCVAMAVQREHFQLPVLLNNNNNNNASALAGTNLPMRSCMRLIRFGLSAGAQGTSPAQTQQH
jgi:hypothetical protein